MRIQASIEAALTARFQPEHLQVVNESHMHSVPKNSETHFKVVISSKAFAGKRPVWRHQQVYGALTVWMQNGVHALALHTYSPDEWTEESGAPDSPDCMGGNKS